MSPNKKTVEELYKGNRSFSVIRAVLEYFSQPKPEPEVENLQKAEWRAVLADDQIPKAELSHVLYKLKYQILLEKMQRQKILMLRLSQLAAILALPLALFFLFRQNHTAPDAGNQPSLVELHCPEGARIRFSLPDGSNGWLAGGSVMTYASDFGNDRNVSVKGEAFFQVRPDEKRPFRVGLGELSVTVLGTQFNVLNYANDPVSEVVVLTGQVKVEGNTGSFARQLNANQKLQLRKAGNKIDLSDVNAKSYTAWTEGRLEFDNENLESVCRKIERFYDVDAELNKEGLENNVLRANVKIGSLEELLKYMSLALPIKYELTDARKSADGKIVRRKLIISKE
ncbi:MAG: FecR domain-containing protein [Prolixibacteraceae bacterium]